MRTRERQERIVRYIFDKGQASVAELSQVFRVSPVTIRHDLNRLAELGRVVRVHGGARIADERTRQELTFATRRRLNAAAKQRIGELAATLIRPVDSILLDASTTAVAVAQAIKRNPDLRDITVVTTGIWTALELLGTRDVHVVLTGGYVRNTTGSITGAVTQQVLESFHIQKAFLGAWGLSLDEGLTDTHLAEVELKQAILGRAKEVVAVLDGTKFGRLGLASFATLEQIDCLVTDSSAPGEMVEALRARGIQVLVAEGGGGEP